VGAALRLVVAVACRAACCEARGPPPHTPSRIDFLLPQIPFRFPFPFFASDPTILFTYYFHPFLFLDPTFLRTSLLHPFCVSLGLAAYWSEPFNRFDGVVVVMSVLDIFSTLTGLDIGLNTSVLRAFRLLRVFKLARSWQALGGNQWQSVAINGHQ
jgi:hypothetical protein